MWQLAIMLKVVGILAVLRRACVGRRHALGRLPAQVEGEPRLLHRVIFCSPRLVLADGIFQERFKLGETCLQ